LSAEKFGVAQTRKRHFLVAVRRDVLDEDRVLVAGEWLKSKRTTEISVLDAIGDLEDSTNDDEYDRPAVLSDENRARAEWLHDNGQYDLPDRYRPECHRDGHTYDSVYGRMHEGRPAPTLSRGFLSPGRGRYVHPTRARSLTPHEGARIQGFPDDFRFTGASGAKPSRTQIANMIGEAVPPPLAFHVGLAALGMLRPGS
jgi:DNA (cytosine-5)-methyltransferase 1